MTLRPLLAAVLACATLLSSAGAASAGDPQKDGPAGSDEASEHFRSGVAFYKTRDFPAALVEFKRAYQLAPNYRVLFNLGQTSRELNDYATALRAFDEYLAEGGKEIPPTRVKDVRGWIEDLKKKVGRITVETNVEGAEILVDDVPVGKAPLAAAVIVNAGQRKFTATLSGYTPVQRAVDITATEEQTVRLELVKIDKSVITRIVEVARPAPPAKTPVAAWVMLSATSACVVATGVLGGLAFAARKGLDGELAKFPGDADAIDQAQGRTRRFAIATDVLGAVSIAGAVTTLVLFVVKPSSTEPAKSSAASVALGPGRVFLRGRF